MVGKIEQYVVLLYYSSLDSNCHFSYLRSCDLFLPEARTKVPALLWDNGSLERLENGRYSVYQRPNICSEGFIHRFLLNTSRSIFLGLSMGSMNGIPLACPFVRIRIQVSRTCHVAKTSSKTVSTFR